VRFAPHFKPHHTIPLTSSYLSRYKLWNCAAAAGAIEKELSLPTEDAVEVTVNTLSLQAIE
jgi:hypothetical protein